MKTTFNLANSLHRNEVRVRASHLLYKSKPCETNNLQWLYDECMKHPENIQYHEELLVELRKRESRVLSQTTPWIL